MRIRLVAALAAALWMGMMATSRTSAAVDLELRTATQSVSRFAPVDITLYAVWDGVGASDFTIVNVALSWDPTVLFLNGPAKRAGNHSWGTLGIYGFELDNQRDRLNADCGTNSYCTAFTEAPFNDGNAFFQALSFGAETASTNGEAIATFSFVALADSPSTEIVIEPILGDRSDTIVQNASVDVLGELFSASITVETDALLIARDVMMPAGRLAEAIVAGEVFDQDIRAVEVLVEIVPRSGVEGTVTFTTETDIIQLVDPWPGVGNFDVFDTDLSGSILLNGSVEDNGTNQPEPLTFSGDLVAMPLIASIDARGTWDLTLVTSISDSWWLPASIKTGLRQATLTIVDLGDGDGSDVIDVRDYAEFEVCFTGDTGPTDPPDFSLDPDLHCGVYDFDDDGDVDWGDYAEFQDAMSGSAP